MLFSEYNKDTHVEFDNPVVFYVIPTVDLPVGSIVPLGYLDKSDNQWKSARKDGRVIYINYDGSVDDGHGNLTAKFFNQRWRLHSTKPGMWGIFSGEIESYKDQVQLIHPEMVLFGDEASTEEQIEKFNT